MTTTPFGRPLLSSIGKAPVNEAPRAHASPAHSGRGGRPTDMSHAKKPDWGPDATAIEKGHPSAPSHGMSEDEDDRGMLGSGFPANDAAAGFSEKDACPDDVEVPQQTHFGSGFPVNDAAAGFSEKDACPDDAIVPRRAGLGAVLPQTRGGRVALGSTIALVGAAGAFAWLTHERSNPKNGQKRLDYYKKIAIGGGVLASGIGILIGATGGSTGAGVPPGNTALIATPGAQTAAVQPGAAVILQLPDTTQGGTPPTWAAGSTVGGGLSWGTPTSIAPVDGATGPLVLNYKGGGGTASIVFHAADGTLQTETLTISG